MTAAERRGDADGPALTAADLTALRHQLGLTVDHFAAELGVTPHVYAAWEAGTLAIPTHYRRALRYRVALAERRVALAASELPECAWVTEWADAPEPRKPADRARRLDALHAHAGACPTCLARERFIAERFGPMPNYPTGAAFGVIGRANAAVGTLPEWLRPAAWGALALGALGALRILFSLPTVLERPGELAPLLEAGAATMGAGAVGGLLYSFIGRPLRRIPHVGPYLAGITAVGGYMAALLLGVAAVGRPGIQSSNDLLLLATLVVFLGVVIGHIFLRDR